MEQLSKSQKIDLIWNEITIAVEKKQIARIYALLRELRAVYTKELVDNEPEDVIDVDE